MRDGLLDVLVITEAEPYIADPFLALFEADPGIAWMQAKQPSAGQFFNSRLADLWDAFVLYDRPGIQFRGGAASLITDPPLEVVRGFDELCDNGHGFVFVHHALGAWPAWPELAVALGARFFHAPGPFAGREWPASGYRPETWHRVSVVDPSHPVTHGLGGGFEITDELFLMPIDERRITPLLLRSDYEYLDVNFNSSELAARGRKGRRDGWQHPPASNAVAWTSRYRDTDVVCIQCGHGPSAYDHPGFRRLLANAVRWVARHRSGGPAVPYSA